jgi:hypothetical protein
MAAAEVSLATTKFVKSVLSLSSDIKGSGSPPTTTTDQRPAGACREIVKDRILNAGFAGNEVRIAVEQEHLHTHSERFRKDRR